MIAQLQWVAAPSKHKSDGADENDVKDGEEKARLEVTQHVGKGLPLCPGNLEKVNGDAPAAARSERSGASVASASIADGGGRTVDAPRGW